MRRALGILLALSGRVSAAPPHIGDDAAITLLYGTAAPSVNPCADDAAPIECMIADRYATDPKAKAIALALYQSSGDIAGVGEDEVMDGGYRGKIHLVPQLPTGRYRQHLARVAAAMKSIDEFLASDQSGDSARRYRWRALAFRFVRSINKRTPSAYATAWSIEYNVEGSLLTSERGVRETLFHELFHLNDEDHGDWSAKTLASDYDAIVAKCGEHVRCYAPYAPNDTRVIATGSYYAFQQDNGNSVHEYAAELAVRYLKEQTEILSKQKLSRPAFKCGPPENARAWKSLVDEFFGGYDRVPEC
ncbi:MAG: hypothetical protein JWO36_1063 [Myxococcales bacterium]|nr:hypothetical protein [Myxococcales bacterium]